MKMKLIAVGTLLLSALGASAQTTTGHWDISVSGGPSFPTGSFGRKDLGNSSSQFALTGWDAQVRVNYRLIEGLDLSMVAGHMENSFDNSLNYPATDYPAYATWRILVGPSGRWFPGDQKKWALTARLLGGLEWTGSNEYQSFSDAPFTLQTGIGAQYNLNRHWYLTVTGDFVTATFKRQLYSETLSGPRSAFIPEAGVGVAL